MKNAVSWDMSYGSCKNQHFGGTYRLCHQGETNQQIRDNVRSKLLTFLTLEVIVCLKHQFLQEPHRVTSQKITFFTITAVKTSNLTWDVMLYGSCRS
jgi:hypothetical protein